MDLLPNEITLIIFDYITKITDKRQFLRTCKKYYGITKNTIQITETNFKVKHFYNDKYYDVDKFTLELCNDKYFDKIPISYFNKNNNVIMKLLTMDGQLELIKLGISKSCIFSYECSEFAAAYGHLDILKWSQSNNYDIDVYKVMPIAAQNGQLEILKWLINYKNDISSDASDNTTLECLDSSLGFNICNNAASNGHIKILKWAKENGYEWSTYTCSGAASNGQFETLKWLRKNGCPWDTCSCIGAARNGHLKILKWLRKNDCPWDKKTCSAAAYCGQFEILKWAIANGCQLDKNSCINAAKNGYFEILKWLRKNGCPWSIDICTFAYNNGHINIVKWCIENGCECDEHILKKLRENNSDEEGNDSKFDE